MSSPRSARKRLSRSDQRRRAITLKPPPSKSLIRDAERRALDAGDAIAAARRHQAALHRAREVAKAELGPYALLLDERELSFWVVPAMPPATKFISFPLDRLAQDGHISWRMNRSGWRLYAMWMAAGGGSRLVQNLEPSWHGSASSGGDYRMVQRASVGAAVQQAILAIPADCRPVCIHVCVAPQGNTRSWEECAGDRRGEGMRKLVRGLRALVKHFGDIAVESWGDAAVEVDQVVLKEPDDPELRA